MDKHLQQCIDHFEQDESFQKEIFEQLKDIKNNHLAHIEIDIAVMKNDITYLKESPKDKGQNAGIEWNTWVIRAAITAAISLSSAIVVALLLRR